MRTIALCSGLVLVIVVWTSVLQTVVVPRGVSSRTMRVSVRAMMAPAYWIARRLPPGLRDRLLGVCAPLSIAPAVLAWVVSLTGAFVLIGYGLGLVALTWAGAVGWLTLHTGCAATLLAMAYYLLLMSLMGCWLLHLMRLLGAYSRREGLLPLLVATAAAPADSDQLLAEHLRRGSDTELGARFAQWAAWLTDLRASHRTYPALLHFRPGGPLSWLDAVVVMLDVAALAEAIAPGWAPPNTKVLLSAGTEALPLLAAQLGIAPHRPVVSLHGRECHPFHLTVQVMTGAIRQRERTDAQMWRTFQHWRAQYAPYACAMSTRLLFEQTTDMPPADVFSLAQHQGDLPQEGLSDDHTA